MKRFTGILAAAAIALAPMSASALEALTDNAMNDVTAQAGVSIALDDIVIYQTGIADTTYTDTDGMTTGLGTVGNVTSAGVKISYDAAIQKLTIIDGITEAGDYSIANMQAAFGTSIGLVGFVNGDDESVVAGTNWSQYMDPTTGNVANAVAAYVTGSSPLTIDVGTCESLTAGFENNHGTGSTYDGLDIAGVIIGLPTIEISSYHTTDTKTVSLVAVDTEAANYDKSFIQITKSGSSKMAILGGRIEIAPH